jgi:hypothetical protein
MAKRVDDNQSSIVNTLRRVGASVLSLADIGKGVPDLLVAHQGLLYLAEVKDGSKSPSRRKLTDDETKFHATWGSHIYILESDADALRMIGAIPISTSASGSMGRTVVNNNERF